MNLCIVLTSAALPRFHVDSTTICHRLVVVGRRLSRPIRGGPGEEHWGANTFTKRSGDHVAEDANPYSATIKRIALSPFRTPQATIRNRQK